MLNNYYRQDEKLLMFTKRGSVIVESVMWSVMPEKCLKRKERILTSHFPLQIRLVVSQNFFKIKTSLHATNRPNKVCLKLCRRLENTRLSFLCMCIMLLFEELICTSSICSMQLSRTILLNGCCICCCRLCG